MLNVYGTVFPWIHTTHTFTTSVAKIKLVSTCMNVTMQYSAQCPGESQRPSADMLSLGESIVAAVT